MNASKKVQLVRLADIEGFQHADDTYWYRPLIFSDRLFTYVAHIPPEGEMPAHEDAHEFDTVLYMLTGTLFVTLGKEQFHIQPNMALHIPGGIPFGVKNEGDITASYVLTFNPPPEIESLQALRERFLEKGRKIYSPEEMNKMAGDALDL